MGKVLSPSSSSDNNKEDSKENKIEVHIGVFFDGTGNSMMNIKEFKEFNARGISNDKRKGKYEKTDSYKSTFSNVARMYQMYKREDKKRYAIYVEGIGTAPRPVLDGVKGPMEKEEDDKDQNGSNNSNDAYLFSEEYFKQNKLQYTDNTLAQGFGIGDKGVNGKIQIGCEKVVSLLNELKNGDETAKFKVTLDVFGFSRGAAAARSFTSRIKEAKGDIHKFTAADITNAMIQSQAMSTYNATLMKAVVKESTYKVCLMDMLKENSIELSEPISVEFLALYDTVSSYGAFFDDDVKELALSIDKSVVKKVFQICAGDEYRRNFSLTLVESGNSPKSNYIIIPGAHSDIGGGYEEKCEEKYVMYSNYFLFPVPYRDRIYAGNKNPDELKTDGWFTQADIDAGKRYVGYQYSILPLNLMIEKMGASNFKMIDEFSVNKQAEPLKKFYSVLKSKKLYDFATEKGKKVIKRQSESSVDQDLLHLIRNQYLHLSSKGASFANVLCTPLNIALDTKRLINAAQSGNVRLIIKD